MLALLCSGQALQSSTMFALTANNPAAEPVFAAAQTLLGGSPLSIAEAAGEPLYANRTAQLLCVTQALALHACIADRLPRRLAVAGYSVGELAAWSIAGFWPVDRALRLTSERARCMDEADDGRSGLGFIRGLRLEKVRAIALDRNCEIAIVNAEDLIVIGGLRDEVLRVCALARDEGARASGPLRANIASHTSRLVRASTAFRRCLIAQPADPILPGRLLLEGSGGDLVIDARAGLANLAAHVSSPFDWRGCLDTLVERGVTAILELGPGDALARMVRARRDWTPDIVAADQFSSLHGLRRWLDRPSMHA